LDGLKLDDTLETNQQCQVVLIDLTKYKQIENSLKKTTEELKLINTTKDKILSIIAHDLRSPFQSLLNASELLATEIKNLSREEIETFSKGLNSNLINLYSLLENLLNWSLMQRNLFEYKPINLNLYEVTDKTIEMCNRNAVEKNISISNKVDTGTYVHADVDMLHSVLQNLLMNAIKFTRGNGQIIVSSIEKAGLVEISIQDNGIGISGEKSRSLFNFDTIFTTNGTSGEKGTGLGLPLCKELVEKQGGKIWMESKLVKGSKFTFTLLKAF
jgi:signal transduction histidine kinase